jgi:hypothetical protein
VIPGSVTGIGESAFDGCANLASVTFGFGSNIAPANFNSASFRGNLRTAYNTGKEGNYLRDGNTWTKQ